MGKLFYSYRDGEVYILHKRCPLELLMDKDVTSSSSAFQR